MGAAGLKITHCFGVDEVGVVHTEWSQDVVPDVALVGFARHGFDDGRKDDGSDVGVAALGSRLGYKLSVVGQYVFQELGLVIGGIAVVMNQTDEIAPTKIGEPGCVGEKMPNRDRRAVGLRILDVEEREMFGHRVVEVEEVLFGELQYSDCGEHLGDRPPVVNCVSSGLHLIRSVRIAKATLINE